MYQNLRAYFVICYGTSNLHLEFLTNVGLIDHSYCCDHVFVFVENLNPSRPNPGRREKIKSNFIPIQNFISMQLSEMHETGMVKKLLVNIDEE